VFLTAEPLVKEPTQEEMEKATCNLKTNKAPGELDIIAELFKNTSQESKKELHAFICKIWRDEKMPDYWKVRLILRRQSDVRKLSKNNTTKCCV
jgi:hypothetical protein